MTAEEMFRKAETGEEFAAACLAEARQIKDMEIRTWRAFGWHACRANWDLGIPIGSGKTEAEAIADLLEREGD